MIEFFEFLNSCSQPRTILYLLFIMIMTYMTFVGLVGLVRTIRGCNEEDYDDTEKE